MTVFLLGTWICFLSWSVSFKLLLQQASYNTAFTISFSAKTHKCNLQPPTVNPNVSAWLPRFCYVPSVPTWPNFPQPLPPSPQFWPFPALSLRSALLVYVFTTTWVPTLGCLSFHLSKFYKNQTKLCHGFLNYTIPHLKLFCKECWFCWLNKNEFARKPSLGQQNSRTQSCKYGEPFPINPSRFRAGVNISGSAATAQLPCCCMKVVTDQT